MSNTKDGLDLMHAAEDAAAARLDEQLREDKKKARRKDPTTVLRALRDALLAWDHNGETAPVLAALRAANEVLDNGVSPVGLKWFVASDVRPADAHFAIVDENGRAVAAFQGPKSDEHCRMVVDLVNGASRSWCKE